MKGRDYECPEVEEIIGACEKIGKKEAGCVFMGDSANNVSGCWWCV